ncbi:hypothetical protein FXO37_16683 [Capsicum annuum]|nr:hypothetical protein FXO37_16683 [Capsicum annuum]
MTNMRYWYVDTCDDESFCLIRGRQLVYSDAYDASDGIMDLNFYNNFKNRYDDLSTLAKTPGGSGFNLLVSKCEWDQNMIDYVRKNSPYPHNKDWIRAKRILEVVNLDVKHFMAIEILLKDPLLDLFLRLLKQSDLMNHLPAKLMNEKWTFEGCNKDKELEKNLTSSACRSYALAYIECLLTGTEMSKPRTLLTSNTVARMHEVWDYGVPTK